MLRLVPPAGCPIRHSDILQAFQRALVSNGCAEAAFTRLKQLLGGTYIHGTLSARSALYLALKVLARACPERDIVAVPAYTCYSVAAAVARADLRVYPVDIDPRSLDFQFDELQSLPAERLLCIVTSNLFGFPNDVDRTRQIASAKGAHVIDDAAQALGARRGGQYCGTGADFGVFSLGRGKALPAMHGGLLVTNSAQLNEAVEAELRSWPRESLLYSARSVIELLGYSAFLRPQLYWIADSLPFLKLGLTEFEPQFELARLPALSAALMSVLLDTLEAVRTGREDNAEKIRSALKGAQSFVPLDPPPTGEPTWIRCPVVAKDPKMRDRAVSALRSAGVGATSFYPGAICDIPGIQQFMAAGARHCPNAEALAQRLLTLPTHGYVSANDVVRIAKVLGDI